MNFSRSGFGGGEVDAGEASFLRLFLRAVEIGGDFFAVGDVVVGENVSVGHVEDFEAEDAGHFLLVDEGGVGVHHEPGVVIEDGVVDAVGSAGADVGGGDAEVLNERREVGAAAEVANVDVVIDMGIAAGGVFFNAVGVAVAGSFVLGFFSTGRKRCRLWGWERLW